MKKVSEIVQRIEGQYVDDECIQTMIPYKRTMTVLNQDGILFHHKAGSNLYINKYLHDERRSHFPYFNIPIHHARIGLKKVSYTNQLFEFEKPYIIVRDGLVSESFAIKDSKQALLITQNILCGNKVTKHMTYEELLNFVKKDNGDEEIYYLYLDGSILSTDSPIYPSMEEIYDYIRRKLIRGLDDFKAYQRKSYPAMAKAELLDYNSYFLNYMEEVTKKIDLSLIDFNVSVGSTVLIVRIKDGSIILKCIDVVFVRENDFKVDIYDIPVTKFALEQLKHASKIRPTNEPKISLRLNPGITKTSVQEAKQMVKALKK